MKTKLYVSLSAGLLIILGLFLLGYNYIETNKKEEYTYVDDLIFENIEDEIEKIVYDGFTREELINKINKSLNSTISNKGDLIVDYSLEFDVDPYLATAIILHETGCKWECSNLVKNCNNVGGQKGSPSCNGGAYRSYETLEEGVKGCIRNLSNNYIKKGLVTPEQIGPKYAASKTWASKINYYIEEIKNKD